MIIYSTAKKKINKCSYSFLSFKCILRTTRSIVHISPCQPTKLHLKVSPVTAGLYLPEGTSQEVLGTSQDFTENYNLGLYKYSHQMGHPKESFRHSRTSVETKTWDYISVVRLPERTSQEVLGTSLGCITLEHPRTLYLSAVCMVS